MVGAGLIGGVHSSVLAQLAKVADLPIELVAVADPLPERREAFRAGFGYRDAFADAHELVAKADVDAVFVCTPTVHHADLVHAVAERRLHLFCEKPLAMSWSEGAAMVDAVERAGIHAQIGLVLRFSAAYAEIRSVLEEPGGGRLVGAVLRDDQCFPIRGMHGTAWRGDRTQTAGGTLIEHGVHDLDLVGWLLGPIASVRAWSRNLAGPPGVEDYVAVDLELESGVHVQVVNVWHDMVRRSSNRRLEVFRERTFVATEADVLLGSVVVQRGDGGEEVVAPEQVLDRFVERQERPIAALRPGYGVAYGVQGLEFVRALLEDRAPSPGMRAGLEAQRVAAAVYESARSGATIELAGYVPEDPGGAAPDPRRG
jgi:UDP-N-acetyl-2-amino-2-deoxyglucuronate dehydrogenase